MLKFFKRLERTRNFVLLIFSIIMVVSLVVFYAPRDTNQAGLKQSSEAAATVGGDKITVGELATQGDSMSQRFGRSLPTKTLLDAAIRSHIVRLEAMRLGLRPSDAEVAAQIRDEFKSPDGTPFDQTRYEQNVTDQFGSVANYEQAVRDFLSEQKLRAFLTSGVTVAEQEIIDDYKKQNSKFDVSYVPVSAADLAQTLKPSDDELKAYFEQNKASYYISSPQKKIRYVFLNTSKAGEKIPIPEADLRAEYDKLPADKKQAGVLGQQIVVRIANPELEAQAQKKADQIVEQARKDEGKITETAFADLARGQSEDPASANNGGKLPGPVKENKEKSDDPYQKLLTMQPGDVSDPIKYKDRFYILRRGEAVPKTFENAKNELEVSLRNRRAYSVVADLAQKVSEDLKQTKDAKATAAKFAAQVNMNPSDMVRETGYVKPNDTIENIGNSPQFEEGIAPLENVGDVGDKVPVKDGFAVPMLVDKKDPRDATFEEVKDQLAETYKLTKAREQIEDVAKQVAAGATSASDLSKSAASKNLKAQDQKDFVLGSPLGQGPTATTNQALQDAIYGLKEGEVTKTPIKVGDNWYVVGMNHRQEADMNDFAKQRDQLIQTKLQQKREQFFADYLASVRAKMEAAGDIKIYQDAIAKIDEFNEANKPPTPPGLPPGMPPIPPQQ